MTDVEDKCLIHEISNSQFNDDPDYVFKSFQPVTQMVVEMDQEEPENPLHGEETYFDGSPSWCISYKTLALFVYHSAMWGILKIVTVEVKTEAT